MQQPNRRNKVKLQVPFEDTLLLGSFLLSPFLSAAYRKPWTEVFLPLSAVPLYICPQTRQHSAQLFNIL